MKRCRHPNGLSSTASDSHSMVATQVPVDSWVDKEDVLHTHTHTHTRMYTYLYLPICVCVVEYYSAIKKNEHITSGSNMYYAQWNKSDRKIQILYDITYL